MLAIVRRLLALSTLALSVTALGATSTGCAADTGGEESEDDEPGTTEDAINAPRASGPLRFSHACDAGEKITIAAVGDVLLHKGLQVQSVDASDHFKSLWRGMSHLVAQADVAYANLEGPTAEGVNKSGSSVRDPGHTFDDNVYSSYPMFNYHPSLVDDLKSTGFDVVSTANNHSLDRRAVGADRTIANLERAGLAFTGTRPSTDASRPWHAMTTTRGVRLAWLACTFSTNGIPDSKKQVLHCYENRSEVLQTIRDLSARRDVDGVIVTPHWGEEYMHTPRSQEKQLAHDMLDAGATAVLGGHPHVVQPWEKHVTPDGREGFVIYSLGNFVSGQSQLPRRSSLVLYLGLTKGRDGKVFVNGVRHVPLTMRRWTVEPSDKASDATESMALTTQIFGEWNRMKSDERLVTNPECR
ncbi:MAG: CapA family protein [Myxococcales bacterium]|nr:CapA family protein [Myxococcales bacterium]